MVERLSGELRITAPARAAWHRPLGATAKLSAKMAWWTAVLCVLTVGMAVLALYTNQNSTWGFCVFSATCAGVGLRLTWSALRLTLGGPTVYLLAADGFRQTSARRNNARFEPWSSVVPDPAAADSLDELVNELSIPPDRPTFDPLNAAQARWLDRVLRIATRPMRKAVRRRIAAGRGAGEVIEFVNHGSRTARVAVATLAGLMVAGMPPLGTYFIYSDPPDAPGVILFMVGLACPLLAVMVSVWSPAGRGRLRITSAVVATETRNFLGRRRFRRARLEEVTSVKVHGRLLTISDVRMTAAGPRRPITFRAPPGVRPAALAEELRQRLGLAPLDQGFPVVVPAPNEPTLRR